MGLYLVQQKGRTHVVNMIVNYLQDLQVVLRAHPRAVATL